MSKYEAFKIDFDSWLSREKLDLYDIYDHDYKEFEKEFNVELVDKSSEASWDSYGSLNSKENIVFKLLDYDNILIKFVYHYESYVGGNLEYPVEVQEKTKTITYYK